MLHFIFGVFYFDFSYHLGGLLGHFELLGFVNFWLLYLDVDVLLVWAVAVRGRAFVGQLN
jgi:hypothetical protein